MSTIDLHGHRKASALQALANELERCTTSTLSVITGTGQHSHGTGAVLRPAVEKFLNERGFRYKYKSAMGIFEVVGGSGELRAFQKSCSASSKLIIEGDERPKIRKKTTKKKHKVAPTTQAKKFSGLPDGPWPEVKKKKGKAPTLLDELKQEKEEVEKGRQASLEEFENEQALFEKEQDTISRALELSSGDDVDEELRKILELSIAENAKSSKEHEDYEEFLQRALEESTQEATEHDEEDALLLEALEFSAREATLGDDDEVFEAVLKASALEFSSVSEADLLRQAIEASVRELSVYPHQARRS